MSRRAIDPSERILTLFLDLPVPEQELLLRYLTITVKRHGQTVSESRPKRGKKKETEAGDV